MELDYYVLFPSVHHGLRLEKKLNELGVPFTLVPTPRELSKNCGLAIRYEKEAESAILKAIEEEGILINGLHSLERSRWRR
jgi:ribosomal protein L7Ae-like RNA K-turn-binding protein